MKQKLSGISDAELTAALSAGRDKAGPAFEELYARYSRKVFLYCRKVCRNEQAASDAYQETWMNFHEYLSKSRKEIHNALGYLLKIARNICLKDKKDSELLLNYDEYKQYTYDKPYEQKELMIMIDKAISQLSPVYRELFVLHELEGLTYEEMAEITGDSIPSMKNRVWRARNKIREILSFFVDEVKN